MVIAGNDNGSGCRESFLKIKFAVSCGSERLRTGIVFVFVCAVGFFFFFLDFVMV